MGALRIIVTILFVLVCIIMVGIIILQEGKSANVSGAINGLADTYWGKNKAHSFEGKLERGTKVLAILFIVLAIVLNMNW